MTLKPGYGEETCWCCGCEPRDLHHIKPRRAGGTDDPANLVALCKNCHLHVDKWTLNHWPVVEAMAVMTVSPPAYVLRRLMLKMMATLYEIEAERDQGGLLDPSSLTADNTLKQGVFA